MTQITHGVRAGLNYPFIYSAVQSLFGAHKARLEFVANVVRPFPGMKVLDVGCGPADILGYMPDVDYWGFDISAEYISQARQRFGARGKFYCKQLQKTDLKDMPLFDVVLAISFLHHIDDAMAIDVMQVASKALKEGGRLLTVDPCLDTSQNPIARFLILKDRGRNVRDKAGYEAIAKTAFMSPQVEVKHRMWIPYTHCLMECRR